jgi:hypothetical protein
MYKSKELMNFLLVDRGALTIPLAVTAVIVLRITISYYEQTYHTSKKQLKEMKMNEKEEKRSLLSQMDPVVVEALREIVMGDMKQELQELRNSDQGCTQKCVLIKTIADKDLARHKLVIKKLFEFEWCDTCDNGGEQLESQSTHANGVGKKVIVCKRGCGPKFVKLCMPSIQNYGQKGEEIAALNEQLKVV